MNEIYNIAYDALNTIMMISDILMESEQDEQSQYLLIHAIRRMSIMSKNIIYEKYEEETKKEADN